ncbi:hypothetical protein BJX62DRAFT_186672 [Aspergillus germanicus]
MSRSCVSCRRKRNENSCKQGSFFYQVHTLVSLPSPFPLSGLSSCIATENRFFGNRINGLAISFVSCFATCPPITPIQQCPINPINISKMALALLDTCRDKLYAQMASSKLDLRVLVGHSNLLDALVDEFNKNPEYYNYNDPTGYIDADATAMCGADDTSRAQDAVVIPANPIAGDTTTRAYSWRFPATDSVFGRYRRENEDEEGEDEDGDWETDDDDDEDPVFSSPPERVLTVRNPDPDPTPTIKKPASRNKLASHILETIPEEDATPSESNAIYLSKLSKQPSTLRRLLSTPTVSKRPASTAKSSLKSKKPLLSSVKDVWWKGGDCVSSPVCV